MQLISATLPELQLPFPLKGKVATVKQATVSLHVGNDVNEGMGSLHNPEGQRSKEMDPPLAWDAGTRARMGIVDCDTQLVTFS